jgi:hypothetical protein
MWESDREGAYDGDERNITMSAQKMTRVAIVVFCAVAFSALASDASPPTFAPLADQCVVAASALDNATTKESTAKNADASVYGDELLKRTPVAINQPEGRLGPADEPPSCTFRNKTRAKRVLLRMIAEIARAAAQ